MCGRGRDIGKCHLVVSQCAVAAVDVDIAGLDFELVVGHRGAGARGLGLFGYTSGHDVDAAFGGVGAGSCDNQLAVSGSRELEEVVAWNGTRKLGGCAGLDVVDIGAGLVVLALFRRVPSEGGIAYREGPGLDFGVDGAGLAKFRHVV